MFAMLVSVMVFDWVTRSASVLVTCETLRLMLSASLTWMPPI